MGKFRQLKDLMKKISIFLTSFIVFSHSILLAYSSNPTEFVNELVTEAIGKLSDKNLSKEDDKDVYALLTAFSKTIYLSNENLIDNVTAISGSGPGYIFYLVEALSQIGIDQGFTKKDANTLAKETLIGSARLIEASNVDPKILKENVTSPGGTTEAGLLVLQSNKNGLYPLLKSTINNAVKRAKELNCDG